MTCKNRGLIYVQKSRFRLPFRKEHGKRVSTLFKFERQHLYHHYWSMGRLFSYKKSFLVICKSLRLFVNTLIAVDKCSLPKRDNLTEPIHLQYSYELETFSWFFPAFSKSTLNFEHFQNKDDAHCLFICEATACDISG